MKYFSRVVLLSDEYIYMIVVAFRRLSMPVELQGHVMFRVPLVIRRIPLALGGPLSISCLFLPC
jgi:hypothetical protein